MHFVIEVDACRCFVPFPDLCDLCSRQSYPTYSDDVCVNVVAQTNTRFPPFLGFLAPRKSRLITCKFCVAEWRCVVCCVRVELVPGVLVVMRCVLSTIAYRRPSVYLYHNTWSNCCLMHNLLNKTQDETSIAKARYKTQGMLSM